MNNTPTSATPELRLPRPRLGRILLAVVVAVDLGLPLVAAPEGSPTPASAVYFSLLTAQVALHAAALTLITSRFVVRLVSLALLVGIVMWYVPRGIEQVAFWIVYATQWSLVAFGCLLFRSRGYLLQHDRLPAEDATRREMQFSLRSLLALTTASAVLAGIASRMEWRWIIYNTSAVPIAVSGITVGCLTFLPVPSALLARRRWWPSIFAIAAAAAMGTLLGKVRPVYPLEIQILLILPVLMEMLVLGVARRRGYRLARVGESRESAAQPID